MTPLHRTSRETHYPPQLDLKDPFILPVQQGMVEDIFIEDLRERGIEITRSCQFMRYETDSSSEEIIAICKNTERGIQSSFKTKYLVGCDGSHSNVRRSMSGAQTVGESTSARWGVLDGVIETDFPDLWSKAVVCSETTGTLLFEATLEHVKTKAQEIMAPFRMVWSRIEWFSVYKVGQRVACTFSAESDRVFIVGDAGHTHSPKAAQGMNTFMHDSFNLAWKLNLDIRGLALPALIASYQEERRKIAQDLIDFDFEHAAAFAGGDSKELATNFATNIGFISGVRVKYAPNVLNVPEREPDGVLRAGELVAPAMVTRYIDTNPVDIELDIPMLGQFRVYFFVPEVHASLDFLTSVCDHISSPASVLGRSTRAAAESYMAHDIPFVEADEFMQLGRYITVSRLFSLATVTCTDKSAFEISHLPNLLQDSKWTLYLDNVPDGKTGKTRKTCTKRWIGNLLQQQVAIVLVRPDGYTGTVGRFDSKNGAGSACQWLNQYFGGFLKA
ncbi:MAG: hypothetical protein M1820_008558 [Bogoriella megaspora]|nr:MAG: hypothetical protein M1820_008558 [Bogoriella megaspora]